MVKPEFVLLTLAVVTFVVFIFTNAYPPSPGLQEGFDGNVPTAPQTSMQPHDTSASTTNDPRVSLPQPVDVEALLEVIKNFQLLYWAQNPSTLAIDPKSLQQVEYFMKQSDNLINQLQAAKANSNAAQMSLEDVVAIRRAYMCTTDILRNKSSPPPPPGPVGTDPNTLTLDTLVRLQDRVKGESLRLANLRSSSENIITRINDLDRLSSDLGDIIGSIQRGQTKIADVNIKPADAERFLSALGAQNLNIPLPPLPGTSMGPVAKASASTPAPFSMPAMSGPIQALMDMAKSMKWSVAVAFENDPTIEQNSNILKTLNNMEASMNQHMVSGTPLTQATYSNYVNKLNTMKGMVNTNNTDVPTIVLGMQKPEVRTSGPASEAMVPTADQLAQAQNETGIFPNGIGSTDDMNLGITPTPTDLQIKHRGSAASFDDSMVGGLDYKTRVLDMCRQIQASGLGDPKNFGCIKNPDEVSASYSWKGNYQMVCSRLGDTWGAWYPQMFGCPAVDPTKKFVRPMVSSQMGL